MEWQPKVPKERKISQSNVILEESKTNIIQARQMSIWDIWQKMLMESGDLLSKCLSTWNLDRPVILPLIPVAKFALEIQSYW